ncbi:MAG: hypothetical protein ACRC10_07535 [Thermoguttaceae bacterium]
MPQFLFAIPLILAFSFVYAGTRHEQPRLIVQHAVRFALSVFAFMIGIALIMEIIMYLFRG